MAPAVLRPAVPRPAPNLSLLEGRQGRCSIRRKRAPQRQLRRFPWPSTKRAQAPTDAGEHLIVAGQSGEATRSLHAAVDTYRKLAADRRARYLPKMADALTRMRLALHASGRATEALDSPREVLGVRRRLADPSSSESLRALVESLLALRECPVVSHHALLSPEAAAERTEAEHTRLRALAQRGRRGELAAVEAFALPVRARSVDHRTVTGAE